MDRSSQRELQHLGLATACAVVYTKVTGQIPDPREPADMQAILNDVAHALSNLVVIYAPDPDSGLPRPIAPLDLIEGKFTRGAQAFMSKGGKELCGLTMQRRDMSSAVKIFLSAHITFGRPLIG